MEDDDEFGDLYTDVLSFPSSASAAAPRRPLPPAIPAIAAVPGDNDDDDEDEILFGSSRSDPLASSKPLQTTLASDAPEDGNDDWLLGRAAPAVDPPVNWEDDDDGGDGEKEVCAPPRPEDGEPRGVLDEDFEEEEAARVSGIPDSDARIAEDEGFGALEEDGEEKMAIGDLDQDTTIPGLAAGPAPPVGPFLGANEGEAKTSGSEGWDSDSEDDLQIVLNDSNHGPLGGERNDGVGGDEEDDDEDGEEDLVIVTDEDQHHLHHPTMEEQDWAEEALQPMADGERKEPADTAKVSGVTGTTPGTRIGYSNHGFHAPHHSMYKYVRPGAAPVSGAPVSGTIGPPGQVRPPLISGPIAGRGRGDWRPLGGRGIPNAQKSFHPGYGAPAWANSSSGRPFGSGLDFTLPSHKTVFDVDIDSFEEKPWRHPGVDMSDFFNFGLDEDKWKEYCKQLDQLRLESTMQSKIRVYESGRSEQEYDPDLPPELAAASGHQDISVGNGHHAKGDSGQADFNGQGRGAATIRPPLPTGRAIQVEGGYGERLPSIDTRPPRIRDSDAIIEIVLQDSLDDPTMYNGSLEQSEKNLQREHLKDVLEVEEDEGHATSGYMDHICHTASSGRKRDINSKVPFEPEGQGTLSFPSEASHQYSKSRSPEYPADNLADDGERMPQGNSRGASINNEHSDDAIPDPSTPMTRNDRDSSDANQVSEVSPVELVREPNIEQRYDEPDDKLALGDSIEVEGEDVTSDIPVSSEILGDDSLVSRKKQKLSSRVEQPVVQDNGDEEDLRASHSDNSRAKSGSSREHHKRRENGEEVIQDGRARRMGDLRRHHEGEERIIRRKDDYSRDARMEMDRNRLASKGREDVYHSYAHRDWDSMSAHQIRDRSFERPKETDASIGVWQRREDNIHGRRLKGEDIRRERSEETGSRHRSKLRVSDRNDRDEELHLRKRLDDGDWRGRNRDGGSRAREREDILIGRRENIDDSHIKRKKEEEISRRGKADKEESLHGYRIREDSSRRKRERDDDIDQRRREDNNRIRDKPEDHHSAKHKDDNWRHREREDRRLKQSHENTLMHREREEGRARGGRVIEDKPLGGRNKEESKVMGSDKDYQDRDRRRHNEQSKRGGDRSGEENISQHKGRGEVHAREKQFNNDERSSRHERLSIHNDRPSSASDSQQIYRDRPRESTRKGKDMEANEQNTLGPGKRKQEDHSTQRNEKVSMKGMGEQESNSLTSSRKGDHQLNEQLPEVSLVDNSLKKQGGEDPTSDDEAQQASRRGRSKLERWTSHKERDYSTISSMHTLSSSLNAKEIEGSSSDMVHPGELAKTDGDYTAGDSDRRGTDAGQIVDKVVEDRDRHLDTVEKLKRRSERFNLPMPGEKDKAPNKRVENEAQIPQTEAASDAEVKPERPARKRKWTGS